MNPLYPVAAVSLALLVALAGLLDWGGASTAGKRAGKELFVYCAAGMRLPMDAIAEKYRQAYGVALHLQYGGSNSLLSQLDVAKTGDLYLAADESYLDLAREKGLVAETFPVARLNPVIAVPRGNPRKIRRIDDLLRDDVRVALANPDQAGMGKVTRECFAKLGLWEDLQSRVRTAGVFKPTVNDVAGDVDLGSVDAGIVWDAVAAQYDGIEIVASPELTAYQSQVGIGVLTASDDPAAALHFARYVAARDRGQSVFEQNGYGTTPGDAWVEQPQLTLFAGAVNRRALEPVVAAFERRHHVVVNTVYNGCGILTAQMESMNGDAASEFPDVYMACDRYYMDSVTDMFPDSLDVSDTPIVIAVAPGNPKQIETIADLARPGVRAALGQPEQCTIGVLSRRLLESAGLYDKILSENVVTQTATSSLLIPSVATGAADAALVYNTDAQAEAGKIDVVAIDSELAQAVQPIALAKSSDQRQLARLLFEAVESARDSFEHAGFRWRLDQDASGR